jgi:protocatechuate 3,4-dioxygenase beta subunit
VIKKPAFFLALLTALSLAPLASIASAQVTSATLLGAVSDPSGAALPGAAVTARNADTGFARTVTTNEAGAYRLEFLPTGTYSVERRFPDSRPRSARASFWPSTTPCASI